MIVPLHWVALSRFGLSGFQVEKPILRPTNHKSSKQRDEPIRIPSNYSNLLKAREKSRAQVVIGFTFAAHWLKKTGTRFVSQSLSVAIAIHNYFRHSFENRFINNQCSVLKIISCKPENVNTIGSKYSLCTFVAMFNRSLLHGVKHPIATNC